MWTAKLLRSTIGCKLVMAITAIVLVFFLCGHLAGNLLVYAGPEALNTYAEGLRRFPAVLWMLRLGTLFAFVLHVLFAIRLTSLNRQASGPQVRAPDYQRTTIASRTMAFSGLIVLAFVGYHLAHLTFRLTHPEFHNLGEYAVYEMVVASFQSPWVTGFYLISVVLLGKHLSHGISSLCQTLGLYHGKYNKVFRTLGPGLGGALAAGFMSIPLAVAFGIVS